MKLTAERARSLETGKTGFFRKVGHFFYEYRFVFLAFFTPLLLMSIAFSLSKGGAIAPFGGLKVWYETLKQTLDQWFPSLGIPDVTPESDPEKMYGTRQMLVIDLWHQYFPFLADLQDKLQNGGSLLWTWSVGMGSNFIAMMSYYLLSPLNFLSVFVDKADLVQYLAVITTIKIGLAGAFTAIAFKIICKKNGLSLVIFSTMYALCSFSMGYYWCTIWLDTWALLPLVVAGTVCMLRDGKYKLFIISLASAVVCNYYIGLFLCIAVVFTAIGYTVSCFESFKKCFKDLLRSVVCTGISLLLTAPVTITSYLALKNCYKSTSGFPTRFDINIGTDDNKGVFEAFHQIVSNMISYLDPTSKEGLPNVACGTLCLILLAVFFCCRKIKLGEKIFCANMLVILIASFIFRPLDYIWHGFHYPNMLPHRFSFIFCFLLIWMAYRAYTNMRPGDIIEVLVGGMVFGLIIYGFFLRGTPLEDGQTAIKGSVFSQKALAGAIATGLVMLVILILYVLKLAPRRVTTAILCLVVVGEMCVVANIGVVSVGDTQMSSYPEKEESVNKLIETADSLSYGEKDFWRMEFTTTQTLNDGALNGINGVSVFNSMANVNITKYVEYLGGAGWPAGNRYAYFQSSPVTNLLFNIKYLISRSGNCLDTVYMERIETAGAVGLYENNAYLSQGFLLNPEICDFELMTWPNGNQGNVDDPFLNQIEFWRLATGIEEPLYTQLPLVDQGHDTNLTVSNVSGQSMGHYNVKTTQNGSSMKLKFNYYPKEDSLLFGYMKVGNRNGDGSILKNDSNIGSINTQTPHIRSLGYYKGGYNPVEPEYKTASQEQKAEKASLTFNVDLSSASSTSVRVFCYALNMDVFNRGLQILGASTLEVSDISDTSIEGTIEANRDGVLYTSIPYEKGWKVEVDGVLTEMSPIGNAMCAVNLTKGTHTVRFYYVPDGFVIGVAGFGVGLILFILIMVFSMKKMKDNPVKKAVVWLFTPEVKESEESFIKKISVKVKALFRKEESSKTLSEEIPVSPENQEITEISEDNLKEENSDTNE